MLQKIKDMFELPSRSWLQSTRPPENTPDLYLLKQQKTHLVFDCNDLLNGTFSRIAGTVFTEQRFHMVLQNHENEKPALIFNRDLPNRMTARARVPGKAFLVSSDDLVEIDKLRGNRVNSDRKLVRIILPTAFRQRFDLRREYGNPVTKKAWVYQDHLVQWKDKFQFDYELFRGRKDSAYLPAPTIKDERPWLDVHFIHEKTAAHKPRVAFAFRDNAQYRADMFHEEKEFYDNKPAEKPIVRDKWQTIMSQVS